jgi:hypothetical protein
MEVGLVAVCALERGWVLLRPETPLIVLFSALKVFLPDLHMNRARESKACVPADLSPDDILTKDNS